MANLINGKEVSASVKSKVKNQTAELIEKSGITPGLAVVIVGNDPASRVYVNSKKKACSEVGFNSYEYALPEDTTQQELLELVEKLNDDPKVNGILCQLPLPKQIDENAIINAIRPEKDVDAFHPFNVGKIMIGEFAFLPCTPAGVLLESLCLCFFYIEAVRLQFVIQKLRILLRSVKMQIYLLQQSEKLILLLLIW